MSQRNEEAMLCCSQLNYLLLSINSKGPLWVRDSDSVSDCLWLSDLWMLAWGQSNSFLCMLSWYFPGRQIHWEAHMVLLGEHYSPDKEGWGAQLPLIQTGECSACTKPVCLECSVLLSCVNAPELLQNYSLSLLSHFLIYGVQSFSINSRCFRAKLENVMFILPGLSALKYKVWMI